jgi:site-specific recombinase XerD
MDTEILDKYKEYLRQNYKKQGTKKSYYRYVHLFLKWLYETIGKTAEELTPKDTKDYKAYCLEKYKTNSNVGRLNVVNNFVDEFLHKPNLRITAPKSVKVNKNVLTDKELEKYIESADTPLERLIALYQIDGLLRPGEFTKLKISLHNLEKQIIYLDDTKTGDTSKIFIPRMIDAYQNYLRYRLKPKNPKDNDYLIIIDKGNYYGHPIQTQRSDFIWRKTKKIGVKAGFKRNIYPYLIKPSVITEGFNKQINPRIIQRQVRHKKIETTLRYDHTSDKMAKDYFNKAQSKNIDTLSVEDKAKVWLDKLLSNEIDLKTFKTGIDVLLPQKRKDDDIGYI